MWMVDCFGMELVEDGTCFNLYSSQHHEGLRPHVRCMGGRFPDPRLRDEDPGVRCSPALRT